MQGLGYSSYLGCLVFTTNPPTFLFPPRRDKKLYSQNRVRCRRRDEELAKITKTVVIKAPVDKVFKVFDDPNAIPLYVPAATNVGNVRQSENRIGDTFRITYGLMGMHFDLDFTNIGYEPQKKIVRRFEGGMKGTMTYTLQAEADETRATFDADYEMSGGILGKAIDKLLVERMNEKNAERMLENLKMMMETKEAPVLSPA